MKSRKCSLFSAVVGALTLTAALAPSARAIKPIEYFNFEGVVGVTPGTFNSVPAPGPGGSYPFLQNSMITNVSFPAGQLALAPGQGTTLNQLTGDVPTTNTALDAMGNDTPGSGPFCFQFGANTTGTFPALSLSFALNSVKGDTANSLPFSTLQLFYATVPSPTAGDFTQIGSDIAISIGTGYYTITQNLPAGTLDQANLTLEFCFSGAKNSNGGAHTYIDNIRLTAVPEPSSYIGGLVGILGLCWFQRRWLVRSLRFRRA